MPACDSAVASTSICTVGRRAGENVVFEFGGISRTNTKRPEFIAGSIWSAVISTAGLNIRFEDCAGYSAGKFGMVFVDDADRHVLDLEFRPGRLRINREGESIDDHDQQDRVDAQAVQLLDAEPEHIGKPHSHSRLLLAQDHSAAATKTSAKTSSTRMSGQSSAKPRPFVNVPRLICVNHPDGKPRPIQRAAPESDEKGTSSPEKFIAGRERSGPLS